MTAGSRGFGRCNSPNSRQGNKVQHDTQQALAFINQGRLQEAEAIYKSLIQQGAGDHLVFGNLGAICTMQGRHQEAATFLKEALAIKPDFPDILANLGYVSQQRGDLQDAIDFCRKALAIKPNTPEALCTLGKALQKQGNLNAAIDAYRKALVFKPEYCDALFNLGDALQQHDDLDAAIDAYRKALALKPNAPGIFNNLGAALGKQDDLDAAVDAYQKALALKPKYPEALSNLGNVLTKQGRLEAAIGACQKALAIKPDFPDALSNLGTALKEQEHLEAAIAAYQKAIAVKPDFPEALSNLGTALKEQGHLEAAIVSYRQALDLKPNYPEALMNLALALMEQGNLDAAVFSYRKLVSLDHGNSDYHYGLAYALLASNDYDNGWQEYEWRLKMQDFRSHAHPPVPQWHGQNHSPGETLMLVSEQGLGDTLQFMRYVPYLKTLFPGMDVAFCAQPKLHGLILCSGITPRVHTPEEANTFTAGKWLPLLSLPRHLKVSSEQPLVQMPYIKAPAEKVHHWQEKLATEQRPIIGLHWQGQQYGRIGNRQRLTPLQKSRSLPLEAFAPISAATAATFLSLQKGDGSEKMADCSFRHRFVACQDEINQIWDFVETAAMAANCDLIITNDTALAHLAGGMGQPTWLLLNKGSEWRWGMEGDTTFWYPSMRLFRQREWGNWAEVMERVVEALRAPPTKEAKPVKTTSPAPGQVDDVNHVQHEGE